MSNDRESRKARAQRLLRAQRAETAAFLHAVVAAGRTPSGKRTLERLRWPDIGWTTTLLNGLDEKLMRSTAHVLHVIAQRLDRYEKELNRSGRASRSRAGKGPPRIKP